MKKLHHHLRKRFQWYHKWHNHPEHKLAHWLSLIVFSELAFLFALTVAVAAGGNASRGANAKDCIRNMPSITVPTSIAAGTVETPKTVEVTLINKDIDCGDEEFSGDISMSDGANVTISPKHFDVRLGSANPMSTAGEMGANNLPNSPISQPLSFTVTYHAGVTAGSRNILVTLVNVVKPGKASTQASIPYVINGSGSGDTVCIRHRPTFAVTPNTQPGAPDQTLSYSIGMNNLDTPACGTTRFSFSAESDPALVVSEVASMKVDPGPLNTQTISVRAKALTQPGDYAFRIHISSPVPEHDTANQAPSLATYHVMPSAPPDGANCKRNAPDISITDQRKADVVHTAIPYEVVITNNDKNCGGSTFKADVVPGSLPAGWTSTPGMISLESGLQHTVTVMVTSPVGAALRDYPFSIMAVNQTSNPKLSSSPVNAVYGVLSDAATPIEPGISAICASGCASPAFDPATRVLQVYGDFTLKAEVSGAYKVAYFIFRVDSMGSAPMCANQSACSNNFGTSAWTLNSPHDINILAFKSDGSRAAHPLGLTAVRLGNPQLGTSAISLKADSNMVTPNSRATLSWTISPAAIKCYTSDNWKNDGEFEQNQLAGGSRVTPPITETTTFTLFCTSPNGADVQKSVTISLLPTSPATPPSGSGDTTPPSVSLSKPADGKTFTVNDVILVRSSASDNVGVTKISVLLNGEELNSCEGTNVISCPFSFTGNLLSSGPNTVRATAFDAAGNKSHASVTVYR